MAKIIFKVLILFIFLLNVNFIKAKEVTKEIIIDYFQNPAFQDLWYGVYDENNVRFGWYNVNEFKDGDFWVQSGEMQLKYLEVVEDGDQLLENEIVFILKTSEYFDYNYPHKLQKIESTFQSNQDYEILKAKIENGVAIVTIDNNGTLNKLEFKNVDIRLGDVLKLEILLNYYDNWQIGEKINYKSYDTYSFEISDEKDILEAVESKFYSGIEIPVYRFKTETSETRSGFITYYSVNSKIPMQFIDTLEIYLLEDKEIAQNISFGGSTNASQMITADQSINNNVNIKKLVLEINGEYVEGFYEGDRQRVFTKDGKLFIELNYDLNDDPPATKYNIEKNLKATLLYPSNDHYFINLAKKIIGNVEDPWDQVQLLLDYVDTYIEDDYTSNSHSVYDIVDRKIGDCTEHALFFNTLARAAGIPSRELTGIINYEDNKFALHAWNEVVINGYWYPVDPTWNYIVPPLTHIKFELLKTVPATYNFKVIEIEYF